MINFNEAVLRTFENEDGKFYYPLKTLKRTRDFVKAVQRLGLELNVLCREVNSTTHDFILWESSKGRSWIGKTLMERINSYIGSIFICGNTNGRKLQETPCKLSCRYKRLTCSIKEENESNDSNCSQKILKSKIAVNKKPRPLPPSFETDKESLVIIKSVKYGGLNAAGRFDHINKSRDVAINKSSTTSIRCNDHALVKITSPEPEKTRKPSMKSGSICRIQEFIDKFNKITERSDIKNNKTQIFIKNNSFNAVSRNIHGPYDSPIRNELPKNQNNFGRSGDADGLNLKSKRKRETLSNASSRDDLKSNRDGMHQHFKFTEESFEIPSGELDQEASFNIKSSVNFKKPVPFRSMDLEHSRQDHFCNILQEKENRTSFKTYTINSFICTNFNKSSGHKELKDSTNFQIKANLSKKLGVSVSEIVSKFNKLQEGVSTRKLMKL